MHAGRNFIRRRSRAPAPPRRAQRQWPVVHRRDVMEHLDLGVGSPPASASTSSRRPRKTAIAIWPTSIKTKSSTVRAITRSSKRSCVRPRAKVAPSCGLLLCTGWRRSGGGVEFTCLLEHRSGHLLRQLRLRMLLLPAHRRRDPRPAAGVIVENKLFDRPRIHLPVLS